MLLALASAAYGANAAVTIKDLAFTPSSVTVNVGESVTWTNVEGVTHSATADSGAWDTGIFTTGSRTIVMTRAGTFAYHCVVHTFMRGTVNVAGQAATPPPTPPPTLAPAPAPTTAPPAAAPTAEPVTPSPAPTSTPTPSPISSASPTATPTAAPSVAQASPSPLPTAPPTSRSDDGPPVLLGIGALILGLALAGAAIYLARRP